LDKVARVYSVQHLFADGMIWRPDTDWAEMVEDNCASFPRGAHDDLVDTTTMALNHLRRVGFALRRDEADAAEAERQYGRPRARVLYEA
jgi:phage terminase large subunit-like protein